MVKKNEKIFIAMSGGVDSSVSAALLKESGYDVTGVFIKTWQPDFLECDWRGERADAMRVAASLGIPFLTCDLEDVYKREVVDYMIREYAAGRTPNPDAMCNKEVKFGAFFEWARKQGAEKIATGHYARIQEIRDASDEMRAGSTDSSASRLSAPGLRQAGISYPASYRLLQGIDEQKDQSYFLWTLSQKVLARTLFPVGAMKKTDVRKEAARLGLVVADKKDSQGVCFLGHVDMKEFLKRFVVVTPGLVLDENGGVIGKHEGALLYTLGERSGFTITKKTPTDAPRYVIAKDMTANMITVSSSPLHADAALTSRAVLGSINWTRGAEPKEGKMLACRFRYRQPTVSCRFERRAEEATVVFDVPAPFVTPGQSLVVYDGDECLGGGTISGTRRRA